MLQSVTAEATGENQIRYGLARTQERVLIEDVVVVLTGPRARNSYGFECGDAVCQRGPCDVVEQMMLDFEVIQGHGGIGRRYDAADESISFRSKPQTGRV